MDVKTRMIHTLDPLLPAAFFSWRYELVFPRIGIRYTYIPKNACSSLKLTLGVSEGWLRPSDDPHSIAVYDRVRGKVFGRKIVYPRILVLRDPGHRAASAFLDRFSKEFDSAASQFARRRGAFPRQSIESITFRDFVALLVRLARPRMDPHWRPQADFLSGEYSHVYMLSGIDALYEMLEGQGVPRLDYRPHATSRYLPLGDFAGDIPVVELRHLRAQGIVPKPDELIDERIARELGIVYGDDYVQMRRWFGSSG